MKIKSAEFLKSCTNPSHFPGYDYPEFAFFGRSNVGKSSLLNMILGQKDLVKTGARPGVTQTINFFVVNGSRSFVDLPGFGYAKLPMSIRKKLFPMVKEYIEKRENLKLAFLLIDVRRVAGDYEQDIIELLAENNVPVVITLTKCDKLSKNQRVKHINDIQKSLGIDRDSIFLTSSETNEGKKELLMLIDEFSHSKKQSTAESSDT
ncbi:MAG: YihA family ribosome biogenesis GTP-binding protein [Spirochaetae bacterium HGW-Spirochaetae-5]|nr:MAG: YihA family ribosome biogenesis GTP-binding protein [Spirochaetae bacterium HGW-Spirochaetae-5]